MQLAERAFLAPTSQGVLVVDPEGRIVLANAPMATMLGADDGALVGRAAVEMVTPEWRHEVSRVADAAMGGVVGRLRGPSGKVAWVQLATAPLREESGTLAGGLWIVTDISEWRRSEQALRAIAETSRVLASEIDVGAIARAVAQSLGGGVVVGL